MRPSLLHLPSYSSHTRLVACLAFLTLFVGQCQSQFRPPQVEITDKDTVNYGFFQQDGNIVENAEYLKPLFQKLYEQRVQGGKKISIVHIGDSHIMSNYLTREVRARLQNAFGDAGRGVVFPYRVANAWGPRDYLVQTNARWHSSSCQKIIKGETPFGISGFSLETTNLNAELTFKLRDTATSETRNFTKVIVFQHKTNYEFDVEVLDEESGQKAELFLENEYAKSFYFERPVNQATLRTRKLSGDQKRLTLDGLSLENELSGVTYHSVGVNGAKYQDFVRAKYFAQQMAELSPDLVILSFGTNEAQGPPDENYMRRSIQNLIEKIQEHSPNALILLTTPADSYLRGGKNFNPHMAEMSAIIRKFARDKGYALWDLYNFSGGENSAQFWKENGLMANDSVHYKKEGYAVQGKLLYHSLIKAYNAHAATKP